MQCALTESPVEFIDTAGAGYEEEVEPDGESRRNEQEARLVERKVRSVPGVTDARVEIVFDPPWDSCKMSDAARLKLGLL